jgi:uncharacterized membrane protein
MVDNELAMGIVLCLGFGWISIFVMLVSLYAWKGDFKSSYNYRPWKPFHVPEETATKIDKEGAKWLFFMSAAFFCAMIVGLAYGLATSNFNNLPNIFLVMAIAWSIIMFAFVIGVYVYAWSAANKKNTDKTREHDP